MHDNTIEYKLYKLYLTITRFFISLTKTGQYHLGTHVWFRDVEYIIINNANMRDRFGRIYAIKRANEPKMKSYSVPIHVRENEISKVRNFKNIWHDATYWWRWYRRNWLMFDANSMVKNRTLPSVQILGKDQALGRK